VIHALVNSSSSSPLSRIGDEQLATLDRTSSCTPSGVGGGGGDDSGSCLAASPPTYNTATINPNRRRRVEQNSQDPESATVPAYQTSCYCPRSAATKTPDEPIEPFLLHLVMPSSIPPPVSPWEKVMTQYDLFTLSLVDHRHTFVELNKGGYIWAIGHRHDDLNICKKCKQTRSLTHLELTRF
jgi:hypothetical protein